MKAPEVLRRFKTPPPLTTRRFVLAFNAAVLADGLQGLLGPAGLFPFDQLIDVAAMVVTCLLLGYHPLLLPTFLLELVPIADLLPAWTASVAFVAAVRTRQSRE